MLLWGRLLGIHRGSLILRSGGIGADSRSSARICQPQPRGTAGDVEGGGKVRAPLLPGPRMLVVPKEAPGSLGIELSQGSSARSAPISEHPGSPISLNSPSPSGKWEGSLPPGPLGAGLGGVGKRAGLLKQLHASEWLSPRGSSWLSRAAARARPGSPARCGACPPRAIWAPGGPGPPRLRARPSAARCPELLRSRAEGLAGRRAGRRGAEGRGQRWGRGRTRPVGRRALSPPPQPGARAAVTSRAALQPRAPAGRARAAAEHMGPRAGRTPGGRDPEYQRGAASEGGPRHAPGTP